MTYFGNEEVTEYLPDDPLADVSDIATINLEQELDLRLRPSNKCIAQTTIRVTKIKSYTTCTICTLTFPNRSALNLHHKTVHYQRFECYVCHKSFNRKSNLITHSRINHTNIKPFRCKYCSLSFARTTELLKHAIFHTGDTRNQCKQCKLVLSSQERLEKHKKTHAVSANLQCHMCGANGFESKKTLSSHIRLHTKACDKKLKGSLLTDVNKDTVEQPFHCEICKKRFVRKSNLMAHVKRHYNKQSEHIKVKTHLCCMCGKLFSYKTHLIRHLHIHKRERPFKCE